METRDLSFWHRKLRAALAELAQQDFGYPIDENEVRAPASSPADLPEALRSLYSVCDGLSCPDVHVGYFLHPASWVVTAARRGEPTRVDGPQPFAIHVFGSDGGGSRFALRLDDGAVYFLPSSGAVHDGAWLEERVVVPEKLADTVAEFLWRLEADVQAFLRGAEDHAFMAR